MIRGTLPGTWDPLSLGHMHAVKKKGPTTWGRTFLINIYY